jgi:hypothetical protein
MKEKYEDIQRKLYYMIPEKWDQLYLYASVIDKPNKTKTGELFFYYIPKGILKKNPVNVYEIASRFNIEEVEYNKLVEALYTAIKQLREEFRKTGQDVWSNLTIIIRDTQFAIEFGYEDLERDGLTSYERHVIWRYKYLGLSLDYSSKEEKQVLRKYLMDKELHGELPKEYYEAGIYLKNNIKNIVGYETNGYEDSNETESTSKNQILF